MARGSELGHTARRRRLDMGLSQARIAEAVGVSPSQIGRWERGDAVPSLVHARALAEALDFESGTAETWMDEFETQVLAIEIVEDPLAPPMTAADADMGADPWSTPPEKRVAPPRLDRAALIGRSARKPSSGVPRRKGGNGSVSKTAVLPVVTGTPDPSLERLLKRQARRDERRLRREMTATHRVERARDTAEARLQLTEQAEATRRAPLPVPPPSRPLPPAPAGAANTGAVFPVPDTKRGSERVTYQGIGEVPMERDRFVYAMRITGTVVTLLVLTGLLWWAVGSLGDGLGAVLDLVRGGGEAVP